MSKEYPIFYCCFLWFSSRRDELSKIDELMRLLLSSDIYLKKPGACFFISHSIYFWYSASIYFSFSLMLSNFYLIFSLKLILDTSSKAWYTPIAKFSTVILLSSIFLFYYIVTFSFSCIFSVYFPYS